MAKDNAYYRARKEALLNLANESDKIYKRILQNGFIPGPLKNDFDKEFNKQIEHQSNDPLSFAELTSFSTYFEMYPKKVAGTEFSQVSFMNPVAVKGTKKDVEAIFKRALQENESREKEAEALAVALQMELELLGLEGIDKIDEINIINNTYNKNLLKLKRKTLPTSYIFKLGKTPLKWIKKGLPNVGVEMNQSLLKKCIEDKHELSFHHFVNLPKNIQNYDKLYKSDAGFVFVTQMVDIKNRPVILAVHVVQEKENKKLKIKSIYGKKHLCEVINKIWKEIE